MSWLSKILNGGDGTPGRPWECRVEYEDGSVGNYNFFAVHVRDAIANVLTYMPTHKDIQATKVVLERRLDWKE